MLFRQDSLVSLLCISCLVNLDGVAQVMANTKCFRPQHLQDIGWIYQYQGSQVIIEEGIDVSTMDGDVETNFKWAVETILTRLSVMVS